MGVTLPKPKGRPGTARLPMVAPSAARTGRRPRPRESSRLFEERRMAPERGQGLIRADVVAPERGSVLERDHAEGAAQQLQGPVLALGARQAPALAALFGI